MNLLSGLERFGFTPKEELNILKEEPIQGSRKEAAQENAVVANEPKETDYLMNKMVKCPICDQTFQVLAVKNAKVKRLEPDFDLRPNFQYIDTLKYDVCVCPHCGYGAMNRFFEHVSTTQRKLIREEVCSRFRPENEQKRETYTYEYAIERYKLSLLSTMAKRGKLSEKAYTCLKIAWLRRAELENLPKDNTPANQQRIADCKNEFQGFYLQAYEGFIKALSTELPPFCGMGAQTIEYMIANMSMYYKKYDVASKLVAKLLTSPSTSKKMKDKCLDLKSELLAEARKIRDRENVGKE